MVFTSIEDSVTNRCPKIIIININATRFSNFRFQRDSCRLNNPSNIESIAFNTITNQFQCTIYCVTSFQTYSITFFIGLLRSSIVGTFIARRFVRLLNTIGRQYCNTRFFSIVVSFTAFIINAININTYFYTFFNSDPIITFFDLQVFITFFQFNVTKRNPNTFLIWFSTFLFQNKRGSVS